MKVIKKDGTLQDFDPEKVKDACLKAAYNASTRISEQDLQRVVRKVRKGLKENTPVEVIHSRVINYLKTVNPLASAAYKDYHNFRKETMNQLFETFKKTEALKYAGDRENANYDTALFSTQQSVFRGWHSAVVSRNFYLTRQERDMMKEGLIYIHDLKDIMFGNFNCCLFDVEAVLKKGFKILNTPTKEPKRFQSACGALFDIINSGSSQQYGGFTVPEVDKILAPYAQKSYDKYIQEFMKYSDESWTGREERAIEYALDKVRRDFDQGWQGIEYKLNTVGSSRGDYPFVTVTLGLGIKQFEKMASISLLEVHKGGQGKAGRKKPVLFPKIVFLYDENIHGKGKISEDVFEAGVDCSAKTMYPDWLSMSGKGYISSMYKQYGKVISPMGCRAFLSPWYERGGMYPADDKDVPVFVGRFNIGAVSLHLPMILAKARAESRDFYEVLDFYLEMIRNLLP